MAIFIKFGLNLGVENVSYYYKKLELFVKPNALKDLKTQKKFTKLSVKNNMIIF